MNHADHVALLRPGVQPDRPGQVWADLGAGDGAFTLALAELLGPGATIHAVDRDRAALARGAAEAARRFPGVAVLPQAANFTGPLDLPPLDGLVMANALHFVRDRDKEALLRRLAAHLKPGGPFLLVEYNVDRGNLWVPHPLSYETWAALGARAGLTRVRLLGRRPSRFLREIYATIAYQRMATD
ncbi:trans-aconitate 2-methyltransferase [Promineifilum sp.]|uniref:class I SAM-dependent methyltransferase n=1 Tax=Promineifilum sp. TaxID=2664178 RepID=UPI0035B3E913